MTHDERELLLLIARLLAPVAGAERDKLAVLAAAVERAGNMASAGK